MLGSSSTTRTLVASRLKPFRRSELEGLRSDSIGISNSIPIKIPPSSLDRVLRTKPRASKLPVSGSLKRTAQSVPPLGKPLADAGEDAPPTDIDNCPFHFSLGNRGVLDPDDDGGGKAGAAKYAPLFSLDSLLRHGLPLVIRLPGAWPSARRLAQLINPTADHASPRRHCTSYLRCRRNPFSSREHRPGGHHSEVSQRTPRGARPAPAIRRRRQKAAGKRCRAQTLHTADTPFRTTPRTR